MEPRILLVEDEPALALAVADRLRSEGFDVTVVEDAPAARAAGAGDGFDLLLLDMQLPGASGFDLCRELRAAGCTTPILMLTARGELADKVLGLRLGADDYLTKPFDMLELSARVEALLRRGALPAAAASGRHVFGEVEVDLDAARVRRAGEDVALTALEFRLLRHFLLHRGELLERDRLLEEVWGYRADVYSRTVDQHVASLRRKLEPDPAQPRYLLTVHGLGYRFES